MKLQNKMTQKKQKKKKSHSQHNTYKVVLSHTTGTPKKVNIKIQ